jgi:hypothetical protein
MPWGTVGNEWWLRTFLLFPSTASSGLFLPGEAAFLPTTGQWNWILELHKDGAAGPSIAFGVATDFPVSNQVGANPKLFMQLPAGSETSPAVGQTFAPALIFDHWYEMLLHVKLDPVAGILEWFLDGTALYSNLSVQTLYLRSTGPSSVNLTMANYRLHATWNSTVYLGPLAIAATKAAVQAAF